MAALRRLLARHGTDLIHTAPNAGVPDWSNLRIAAAAGVWLGEARPGDTIEIVSDDRAFDGAMCRRALASASGAYHTDYSSEGAMIATAESITTSMVVPDSQFRNVGVMALPASLIDGILWRRISPAAPFAFGAILAALALIGLAFVLRMALTEEV